MKGPLWLAWRYVIFHKAKSLILVACIVLTTILPVAVKLLVWQFDQKIVARAASTPSIVGAKGSSLDLVLSALYFKQGVVEPVAYAEVERARGDGLATAIPLHCMFTAMDYPVVGTSLEYFDYRELELGTGTLFVSLGDCVVGHKVAETLSVNVGDQIISDRANVLDLAGQSPLKLNVVGVLEASRTPDDWAVFVDLKTAWVIQGLGHGHQDLNKESPDSPVLMASESGRIIANRGVVSYIEITDENADSFHFHGDTDDFPVTAILVSASGFKEETILQGRYDSSDSEVQFVRPEIVVRDLMTIVFQVNRFFNANAILIGGSTAMLLVLVVLLSLRLRKREMETMFRLGCSRGTIVWLQVGEMGIIFGLAMVFVLLGSTWVWMISGDIVEGLLVNSR